MTKFLAVQSLIRRLERITGEVNAGTKHLFYAPRAEERYTPILQPVVEAPKYVPWDLLSIQQYFQDLAFKQAPPVSQLAPPTRSAPSQAPAFAQPRYGGQSTDSNATIEALRAFNPQAAADAEKLQQRFRNGNNAVSYLDFIDTSCCKSSNTAFAQNVRGQNNGFTAKGTHKESKKNARSGPESFVNRKPRNNSRNTN